MNITPQSAAGALWATVKDPAAAARQVLPWQVGLPNLWSALLLVAVLNVLMLALLQAVSPVPVVLQEQGFVLTPFSYAAIIVTFLFLMVYTLYHIGRMLGGVGTIEDSLKVIILFQAVSVSLEAVQVVLVMISPLIAGYFGIISVVILVRCVMNFVNVMHRFESIGKTLVVMVLALIATAMIAGIVLSVLGVAPTGVPA
ncbi:MAG: YIP1 family protein [Loktanella sp.]|nr:YIP1 family protein [Loktanella sp.]